MPPTIVKAHAFGNDFLLMNEAELPAALDRAVFARRVCDRHRGIGADGLILFGPALSEPGAGKSKEPALSEPGTGESKGPALSEPGTGESKGPALSEPGTGESKGARMSLLNADGSYSEVSGNGVRCLGAWLAWVHRSGPGAVIDVHTDAGVKRLELLEHAGGQYTFRARMGQPENVSRVRIEAAGEAVEAVTLRVGNPQCVVLGEVSHERLHTLAAALAVHPHFPAGSNVELATVVSPGHVRILIWERGVGPTEASGTGACAAAVAAMSFGGAARDVQVESPGGTQRVEWREDGLYLTGWAEVTAVCEWRGAEPDA